MPKSSPRIFVAIWAHLMLGSTHQSAEVLRRHTGFHLNSFAYTDVSVFRKAQISTQLLSRPHKAETCSQVEHLLRVTNVECSRQPAGLQDTIRSAASAPADAESSPGLSSGGFASAWNQIC